MACARLICILFVSVFFCVFSEGALIDEGLATSDMDISNTGIAYRSLYRGEVENIPSTVNILSLLNGDTRKKNSAGAVNMEKFNVSLSKLWQSSGKPAIDKDDEAEKEPILEDNNSIPMTFKDANSVEVVDNTVPYDDIVHIGPANYEKETANVNIINSRRERATETTESSEEDVFDVDGTSSMNNMKTMIGLDENMVTNIGRQIFLNKVIFRVQLKMEYDTDNIPPDIKTDGILGNLNFKLSPAEEVKKNITMLMLEGDIDRKPIQGKQTTQSNRYSQESKYNPTENVELKSIVEYSTEDMHTEEVSIDTDATTDTENILDESRMMFGKSKAIKISLRSNFADDYPTVSDENATDEVNINESSITEAVTEAETTQHNGSPSTVSGDTMFGDAPKLGGAEAMIEKHLERFMFMEMGLGMVIVICSVTTIIQVMVLVKKLKGMRNKYECTAVSSV